MPSVEPRELQAADRELAESVVDLAKKLLIAFPTVR
jgi:hypothetical protein